MDSKQFICVTFWRLVLSIESRFLWSAFLTAYCSIAIHFMAAMSTLTHIHTPKHIHNNNKVTAQRKEEKWSKKKRKIHTHSYVDSWTLERSRMWHDETGGKTCYYWNTVFFNFVNVSICLMPCSLMRNTRTHTHTNFYVCMNEVQSLISQLFYTLYWKMSSSTKAATS